MTGGGDGTVTRGGGDEGVAPGDFTHLLARRTSWGRSDAIDRILSAANAPGVLSMAGGIPAPDSFPVARLAEVTDRILSRSAAAALQYAPTAGTAAMREAVARRAGETGAPVGPERAMVTGGSQQGLDLVARTLLDEGDLVALDDPSYLGAVQSFRGAGARLLPLPTDRDGMRTDVLAERLAAGARPKLVYVVPHFHNPTGGVLTEERRRDLAALADRYGFLIVEDDPYGDLAFDGERLPSTDAHGDRVIRLMSLSKTLCPGFRVAGLTAPAGLVRELVAAKQSSDLQTNTFGQHVLAELLGDPAFLPAHLARLRTLYGDKARATAALLRERLPWLGFDDPRGGLFFWCSVDDPRVTSDLLYEHALAQGLALVPGAPFCIEQDGSRLLRLSFATLDEEQRREGVSRLATAFDKARADAH
ncbi:MULTISPECIES: PLP-dependent aminotransferase family protein [unclassified Streptomyces]|uniref:aminotransferase-like domain-containing protein n=1 Tax=unclassified Streptomyces TaxID=2593676 RepID=UPI0037F9B95C